MLDLLGEELFDGRKFKVEVENFYHSGMGRFVGANPLGKLKTGTVATLPNSGHGISRNDSFIVELLDDLSSFATPARTYSESFGQLADLVAKKCNSASRLSHLDKFLPGYGSASDVSVKILGPILEKFGPNEGLRKLGSGDYWTI